MSVCVCLYVCVCVSVSVCVWMCVHVYDVLCIELGHMVNHEAL